MGKPILTQLGCITISDDVIASVAGMAATECYGLVGMASRTLTDGIAELRMIISPGRRSGREG